MLISSIKEPFLLVMSDPPTGTMKFLSVDWIIRSIRFSLLALLRVSVVFLHCSPYALLTIWNKPAFLAILHTVTTSYGYLGAKQEVVLMIQRISSLLILLRTSSKWSMSVSKGDMPSPSSPLS